MLEGLPAELIHRVAYEIGGLSAADVGALARTSRYLRAALQGTAYSHDRHLLLGGPAACVRARRCDLADQAWAGARPGERARHATDYLIALAGVAFFSRPRYRFPPGEEYMDAWVNRMGRRALDEPACRPLHMCGLALQEAAANGHSVIVRGICERAKRDRGVDRAQLGRCIIMASRNCTAFGEIYLMLEKVLITHTPFYRFPPVWEKI